MQHDQGSFRRNFGRTGRNVALFETQTRVRSATPAGDLRKNEKNTSEREDTAELANLRPKQASFANVSLCGAMSCFLIPSNIPGA